MADADNIARAIAACSALVSAGSLYVSIAAYRRNQPRVGVSLTVPRSLRSTPEDESLETTVRVHIYNEGQAEAVADRLILEIQGFAREYVGGLSSPSPLWEQEIDLSDRLGGSVGPRLTPFEGKWIEYHLEFDQTDLRYLSYFRMSATVGLTYGKTVCSRWEGMYRDYRPPDVPIP